MKVLRAFFLTALAVVVLAATTIGAGWAARHFDDGTDRAAPKAATAARQVAAADPSWSRLSGADYDRSLRTRERLQVVLEPGDTGTQVRELQHRLFQLAWWPGDTTGRYQEPTRKAVADFQAKRGFEATGVVDEQTWRRLLEMSAEPTHDQLFNILRPGPTIHGPGDSGEDVREVQARLVQIAWLHGDVSGTYDAATQEAVRGFQAKREIPTTGEVDQRTLDRLVAMTTTPTHAEMYNIEPEPEPESDTGTLDPRCLTGEAMCIDKSTNTLTWVVDGEPQMSVDVRFGSEELPTREGAFTVFMKSRDHVSSLYDTSMPYAMFFSGGQAVHYSPDFAANGYNGASHGCVNVRDHAGIVSLFEQVDVGDKVIVHWS